MISIAECALLAACAESMYTGPGNLAPDIDSRIADRWTITSYITAKDAIFGAQAIGLGELVYYGFIAQSKASSSCAMVIRGTESAVEWIENIEGILIPGLQKGMVEAGFWSIYNSMQYKITDENNLKDGAKLTIIGHSLGAALATYLMVDLVKLYPVNGVLFASPRAGDGSFCNMVDKTVGTGNYESYAYIRDIVPHVPIGLPFGLGFQSLSNTKWITPFTSKAKIKNNPICNHDVLNYSAMLTGTAVTDNCIIS